jgi:hypothetical protein
MISALAPMPGERRWTTPRRRTWVGCSPGLTREILASVLGVAMIIGVLHLHVPSTSYILWSG